MQELEKKSTDQLVQVLWDYNLLNQTPQKSDAILVLGSNDIRVAQRGIDLYFQNLAPLLIFSGNYGKLTKNIFKKPEAEVFAQMAIDAKVPAKHILIENESTNTGQNITFTKNLLAKKQMQIKSLIAVHKPYMERRTFATLKKQWPQVKACVTSPQITYKNYPNHILSKDHIINITVADTQKGMLYAQKGFSLAQPMPKTVWAAYTELVKRGFTKDLVQN